MGGQVKVVNRNSNVDYDYGIYESLQDVPASLMDTVQVGKTIGVLTASGEVKEYWWQPTGNNTFGWVSKGVSEEEMATALGQKAEKASNPTAGNIAILDENGNPVDSGSKVDDFAPAGHTHQATHEVEDRAAADRLIITIGGVRYAVKRDILITPATPVIKHGGAATGADAINVITTTQGITLTCSTEGATIYYTTDGSDPTASSNVYSSALTFGQDENSDGKVRTVTLKAIAIKNGESSQVATATFNITRKVANPVITYSALANDTVTRTITITCATGKGESIYYTLDGSDPSDMGNAGRQLYNVNSKPTVTASTTIKAYATIDNTWEASSNTTVDIVDTVAAPTISVDSTDKYAASHTVTITCGTAGAAIFYTTDGSTPVPSEADQQGKATKTYASAITLSTTGTHTVKAVATKSGWTDSATASKTGIVVGAKKSYIGGGGATLSSLSGLTAVKADSLAGSRSTTLAESAYIWFVVPSTSSISSILSGKTEVPYSLIENSVSGYKCYRTVFEINAGTHTFNIA